MSLFKDFSARMPDNEEIAREAAEQISKKNRLTPDAVRANFSSLVTDTEAEAHRIYRARESEIGEEVIAGYVALGERKIFSELNSFFLSLSQSRKTRAGTVFEGIIRTLFKRCGYPFEEQCIINGKPDFLMPSKKHFEKNAPDCIIFTAKRTVRERWRQIATEGVRGLGFFLATIDQKVTAPQADEMLKNRIYLVIPKNLKTTIKHYKKAVNIISFEDFFSDHLNPALNRWKKAGAIK